MPLSSPVLVIVMNPSKSEELDKAPSKVKVPEIADASLLIKRPSLSVACLS